MAKNKKNKQEIEHQAEEEVIISAPVVEETVVEEQPVVVEEQPETVEAVKEEQTTTTEDVVEPIEQKSTDKTVLPKKRILTRHEYIRYVYTHPELLENNF